MFKMQTQFLKYAHYPWPEFARLAGTGSWINDDVSEFVAQNTPLVGALKYYFTPGIEYTIDVKIKKRYKLTDCALIYGYFKG
jgi:hypothetical protein